MRKIFVFLAAASALVLAAQSASQAANATGVLLVANSDDVRNRAVEGYITFFDPETGAVLAKVPDGGVMAHELIITQDGRYAFAPIYGTGAVGGVGTNGSTISIIDIAARKVVGHIPVKDQSRPHYGVVGAKDGLLYVTTEMDQSVIIVDPNTRKVVGSIPTGQPESHNVAVSRDGLRAYTSNVYAGTVSVMDIPGRNLIEVIKITNESRQAIGNRANWRVQRIAISNDDKTIYTCDWETTTLVAIDAATRKIVSRTPMASSCYGITPTPDGRWLLASNNTANKISVVDVATMKVERLIDVPAGPQGILIRPDGKVAYTSSAQAKAVAAIRLSDWTVERTMPTGNWPDGMGFGGVAQ